MEISHEEISEGMIKYLRILFTSSFRFKTIIKTLKSKNVKDRFVLSSEDLQALMKDFFIPINKTNQNYCYMEIVAPMNPKIRVHYNTLNLKTTVTLDKPALVLIIEEMVTEKELRQAWKALMERIENARRKKEPGFPNILEVLSKGYEVKKSYSNIDLWLEIYKLKYEHEKAKVKNSYKRIAEILKASPSKKTRKGVIINDTYVRNAYYQIRNLIKSL